MPPRIPIDFTTITSSSYQDNLLCEDQMIRAYTATPFQNVKIRFSSFLRLSIKKQKIQDCDFLNCIFEDIYAREASFRNINFTGTTFRNAIFHKAEFYNCNFRYCTFINCEIPHEEIIPCLPTEPNLRRETARNLKINYANMGEKAISDIFLDIEIQAESEELWYRFLSQSSYYKQRYDALDRLRALAKFLYIKTSGFIWGYGHRNLNLIVSFTVFLTLLSFILLISNSQYSYNTDSSGHIFTLYKSFLAVSSEAVDYPYMNLKPLNPAAKAVFFAARVLGIMYLGLLGATLYRRIAR